MRQKTINHLGEFFGVGRIEASGHSGRANFLPVAPTDLAWNQNQQSDEREGDQILDFGVFHDMT
jgi:hypothetical protein